MPFPNLQTRKRSVCSRWPALVCVLSTALGLGGSSSAAQDRPPDAATASIKPVPARVGCPLCELSPDVPIVRLTDEHVHAVGRALSQDNELQIARIDSLYEAGALGGPAGSPAARRNAHLMARLATANAYAYMVRFATDPNCVYEADEAALVRAFGSFSDPGLYPITRLRRARMGRGAVCLKYDLRGDLDTLATLGERQVRVRTRTIEANGTRRRMLSMMLPTGLDDVVEVLMDEHYTCRVDHERHAESTGALELFLLHDMDGFLLRKWGTHKPTALMFWTMPDLAVRGAIPDPASVGVRIYVPELTLKLPLLPDVGFDDLREIDLPQPILRLEYLHGEHHPEWLQSNPGGFAGWTGNGPIPDEIRSRFPDK
jgi:hypothetical protein